jgi:hypothetical protein
VDYVSVGSLVSSIRDQVGQLGESGEYQMERVRVICFHVQSSEGGSPHLCQLRTALVVPYCSKHSLCTGAYGRMIPYLASWMYNGIVCGPPTVVHRGYHMEDDTRARKDLVPTL